VYLRTPTTDGVASSVLESLALKVPVVASENGSRPAGTVLYRADDPADMAGVVQRVIENRAAVIASIPVVEIPDTLSHELELLCA
jgi:glycosyltransferase involved in cell wall biosynthesis